jgi:hypothetical protein
MISLLINTMDIMNAQYYYYAGRQILHRRISIHRQDTGYIRYYLTHYSAN